MMTDDFSSLVERRLKLRSSSDSDERELIVRIGKPFTVSPDGDAACPVSVDGLLGRLPDIHGIDEMDALRLAIDLIEKTLRGRVDQQIFWSDGEPYV